MLPRLSHVICFLIMVVRAAVGGMIMECLGMYLRYCTQNHHNHVAEMCKRSYMKPLDCFVPRGVPEANQLLHVGSVHFTLAVRVKTLAI